MTASTRFSLWRGIACAAVLSCLATGCGYTTRSMIASQYRTIYITPFVNKVDITRENDNVANNYHLYRPMLETEVTSAVVQKYLRDGNLRPVHSKDNADLVLEGQLVDFRKDALRYTTSNDVQEYRVNVAVNMALYDEAAGHKLLWQENGFTGIATYFVTGAQAGTESGAITDAITDLSRRIVERTVDQW